MNPKQSPTGSEQSGGGVSVAGRVAGVVLTSRSMLDFRWLPSPHYQCRAGCCSRVTWAPVSPAGGSPCPHVSSLSSSRCPAAGACPSCLTTARGPRTTFTTSWCSMSRAGGSPSAWCGPAGPARGCGESWTGGPWPPSGRGSGSARSLEIDFHRKINKKPTVYSKWIYIFISEIYKKLLLTFFGLRPHILLFSRDFVLDV